MDKYLEVKISVPDGCSLVGCRTEGDTAIVIFEDARGPEIRPIGFCRDHSGEVSDDFEDEDCSKGLHFSARNIHLKLDVCSEGKKKEAIPKDHPYTQDKGSD